MALKTWRCHLATTISSLQAASFCFCQNGRRKHLVDSKVPPSSASLTYLADQKLSNGKNSSACLRCLDLSQSACLTTSKCLMFNVWTLSIRMPQTFVCCLLALTWLPAFISISPPSVEVVWCLPMSSDVSQATDIWSESTLGNKIPATLINCTGEPPRVFGWMYAAPYLCGPPSQTRRGRQRHRPTI